MKNFRPENRFIDLSEALRTCIDLEDSSIGKDRIFTVMERMMINQERGRLLAGNHSWEQEPMLELKIRKTLADINN